MAITTGHLSVGVTPLQIDGRSTNPSRIRIFNASNDKTVFLGNENVTINNGFGLVKLEQMDLEMNPNEVLYAVAESAGAEIQWIRHTQD